MPPHFPFKRSVGGPFLWRQSPQWRYSSSVAFRSQGVREMRDPSRRRKLPPSLSDAFEAPAQAQGGVRVSRLAFPKSALFALMPHRPLGAASAWPCGIPERAALIITCLAEPNSAGPFVIGCRCGIAKSRRLCQIKYPAKSLRGIKRIVTAYNASKSKGTGTMAGPSNRPH